MLLLVDVGNSNMVLGLYEGDTLRGRWRVITNNYRTADELHILLYMLLQQIDLRTQDITGCCISSVVPQLNQALTHVAQDAFGVAPLMVGPGVKTGVVLQVNNPKEVGADRIVNTVGAVSQYEGALIIIDFGTATTFDVVSSRAEWQGGVIAPGIGLSADALFERCAKLPRVDVVRPDQVIGKDTIGNICSGLTYGYADMVDGLVRRMAAEMTEKPTVVATGGFAKTMAQTATQIDVVDSLLTLKGLKAVYEKNQGTRA